MRIDIITVLPEMIEGFVRESILARAQKKGLAEIHLHNLRDYTLDKWRRVDDYPYGGFAGMVMHLGAEGRTRLRRGYLHLARRRAVQPTRG